MSSYILEMKNITKKFPGVTALNHVNLSVQKGEIHALCGENGAGKSTLMKVLSGAYPYKSYTGDIVINGNVKQFYQVKDSEKAGIAIIYQELSLVKDLTVAENIFMGKLINYKGIVNWNRVFANAKKILTEIGVDVELSDHIGSIGVGQQQLVEIAKALVLNADILILDEPTAALAEHEVELLMKILRKLRNKGVTCILITHKLNEIFEIADRITVLRDGATIRTLNIHETNENEIVKYMVGRELTQRYPQSSRKAGQSIMTVKDFSLYNSKNKQIVHNVSFEAKAGEIVGISGLMGAGRTELITGIFGFFGGKTKGNICVNGKKVKIKNPTDALKCSMAIVSEDRKRYGLIMGQSICNNISVSSMKKISRGGILNRSHEYYKTNQVSNEIGVKANSVGVPVNTLSGGNQQKVLLARCLMTKPQILFLDEPTRGIDVGAKYEIYELMNKLASQGTAIIMISSELPEIIGMSDRVLVMRNGAIVSELTGNNVTQENIMIKASGGN